MIIVADTSALLAAFDPAQDCHEQASTILQTETLHISPLVMTEFDHMLRRDYGYDQAAKVSSAIIEDLNTGVHQLAQLTPEDFATADEVRNKYVGLRLDLADSIGVALAAKYRTNRIFTLDQRDFRAISPLTESFGSFEILPADLD
ncbi:type II toxin-antitoxin system VapC family toxin [Glycomyces arizonensis]|uniref:type II toxin-antitoxin system VapC family toxin n=1 Tax=Glycomyces arizonensis TaxID=256035 RepID=UPI0003F71FE5|nr:PIN domain-containing protein [Glycomyces arizonensis]